MKKYLLLLLVSLSGFSQTLDSNFGINGAIKAPISNSPSTQRPYTAALQTDGKIVYAGNFIFPNNAYSFIARFNADGSKDNAFNQYGFKKTDITTIKKIVIQDDGKIIMAGGKAIYRLLPNGDADTSFNSSGKLTLFQDNQTNPVITDIIIQPDNKIVLTGYRYNGTNNDFLAIRISNNGVFDLTFDNDGILITPMGTGFDQSYASEIQPDGRIILFGSTNNTGQSGTHFSLLRINPDGSLDTTFGVGGKVFSQFIPPVSLDYAKDGKILADGSILVFGKSNNRYAFIRYTSLGDLDTTFNGNGKLVLNLNSNIPNPIDLSRMEILSNGKILASGSTDSGYTVLKLFPDGTYDTSFGLQGSVAVDDNTSISTFLLEKPDGKIITGGYSSYLNSIKQIELDTDGNILSNETKNLYTSYDNAIQSVQLSNQSYITLTNSLINNDNRLVLKKFLSNGTQDLTFGNSGNLMIGGVLNSNDFPAKMKLCPNDKILLSCGSLLYKFNANGTADISFGINGVTNLATAINNSNASITELSLTADNKIIVGYPYTNNDIISVGIFRLNPDGTFDDSFGNNGATNYRFHENITTLMEWPTSLCTDSDNNIIVYGVSTGNYSYYPLNYGINILKISSTGSLDTSFGTNGVYSSEGSSLIYPDKITTTSDNQYLLSYSGYGDSALSSKTLKITSNGINDVLFGLNGISNDVLETYNSDFILQSDGKILKAGNNTSNQFSISRYNPDGSVDAGFGTNGVINTSVDLQSGISNLLLQNDGKLLATGTSFDGDRQVVTLVRYTGLNLGTLDLTKGKNGLMLYPNPIVNDATFQYTLTNNENVSIDLIDVQGRVIKKVITNENQNAGLQTLQFSLDETVNSGNYFLRIASGKVTQSVQLIKK